MCRGPCGCVPVTSAATAPSSSSSVSPAAGTPAGPAPHRAAFDQREAVANLLDRWLGQGRYTIVLRGDAPLTALLQSARTEIAESLGPGCYLSGAYFASEGDGEIEPAPANHVHLVLYGHVFKDGDMKSVKAKVNERWARDPAWQRLPRLDPQPAVSPGAGQPRSAADVTVHERGLVLKTFQASSPLFEMRKQLRTAIAADSRLNGAWVDLADCPDYLGQTDHYEVYLWLDEGLELASGAVAAPQTASPLEPMVWVDRCGCWHRAPASPPPPSDLAPPERSPRPLGADGQRILVQQILDRRLGPDRYAVVGEAKVPYSRLAAQLRKRMEALYGPGNFLNGLRYVQVEQQGQDAPIVKLKIEGRELDDSQRKRIKDECQLLVDADPAWRRLPGPGGCRFIVDDPVEADPLSEAGREKLAAIRTFLFTDPQLHGTWVDIAECKNLRGEVDSYDVCLWVDSDKAATQKEAVRALLNRSLGAGRYSVVKESALPLSRAVAALQRMFPGENPADFVCGAYYMQPEPPAGHIEIALYGGARDENARKLILTAFNILREHDSAWANPATLRGNKLLAVDRKLLPWTLVPETKRRLAKIYQEIDAKNDLRGAWIELAECRDHTRQFLRYNLHLRYDIDASAEARRKLKEILADNLRDLPYVITCEEPLPLGDLALRINSLLGLQQRMDGCVVQGCCFRPVLLEGETPPRTQMTFLGRVADEQQRETLTRRVKATVESAPDLQGRLADIDINTRDGILVVAPDSAMAPYRFNLGLRHFWNNDFAGAAREFLQASAEAPNTVEYRYWQALCELKQGRSDRASWVMQGVVARQPSLDAESARRVSMSLPAHPRRHAFGPGAT